MTKNGEMVVGEGGFLLETYMAKTCKDYIT